MITTLASTLTDLVVRTGAAYGGLNNAAGASATPSRGVIDRVSGGSGYGPSSPTALIVIGLVVLAVCVCTLYVVRRDGYGPVPTRDDYDTRRPEP